MSCAGRPRASRSGASRTTAGGRGGSRLRGPGAGRQLARFRAPEATLAGLAVLLLLAAVLTVVIKAFAVEAFRIPSGSMRVTLRVGDRVLVNKLVYRVRGIDRGDVIVFSGQGSWDPPSGPPPGPVPAALRTVLQLAGMASGGTAGWRTRHAGDLTPLPMAVGLAGMVPLARACCRLTAHVPSRPALGSDQ